MSKCLIQPLMIAVLVAAQTAFAAPEKPSLQEQLHALETMCAESSEARAERQAAKPLAERLGGYDRILEMTTEIVRLHNENETIKHLFKDVDSKQLAKRVADFVSAGTGGKAKYSGRDMVAAHAHMKLTDEHFLSAGGDVVKAMSTMGHGQDEINEIVCILMSLKDQVVLKEKPAEKKKESNQ